MEIREVSVVVAVATVMAACAAPPPAPAPAPAAALETAARAALDQAADHYREAAQRMDPGAGYPRSTQPDGAWRTVGLHDWTSGFFPGTLWYLYEHTGDAALRAEAERWTRPLAAITRGRYDHDLGFQFGSSFGNAYRITGDENFRPPLLEAARHLAGRFDPRVGLIRSWDFGEWSYPVIVDNLMNLELLFRGAAVGGDPEWAAVARAHADRTLREFVRADGGTFHVVDFEPASGAVVRRMTHQGHGDATTWARGQAWAVYGYTVLFRETGDATYLDAARRLVGYVLPRLPEDRVPCWDFQAPGCPQTAERDASAAAILASALLELGGRVGGDEGARYHREAERILASLLSPDYLAPRSGGDALLRRAVGHHPAGTEIGVGIVYADYYFVEALLRYLRREGG